MTDRKYLFGPVPSRRFGRSLGIDLTPYKTCTLDCVFCQLGRTTHKTVERREYVNMDEVLIELEEWIEKDGAADYITLSGSGEPTLHERFGDILGLIREKTDIPSLLLTNGTFLHLPKVRMAAAQAGSHSSVSTTDAGEKRRGFPPGFQALPKQESRSQPQQGKHPHKINPGALNQFVIITASGAKTQRAGFVP